MPEEYKPPFVRGGFNGRPINGLGVKIYTYVYTAAIYCKIYNIYHVHCYFLLNQTYCVTLLDTFWARCRELTIYHTDTPTTQVIDKFQRT